MIVKKLLKIVRILTLITVLLTLGMLFYPKPRLFWNIVHSKKIQHAQKLSTDLGAETIYNNELECWNSANTSCGILYVFSTNMSFDSLEKELTKIVAEVDPNEDTNPWGKDGFSIITKLTLTSRKSVTLEGKPMSSYDRLHLKNEPNALEFRFTDQKGWEYNIGIFEFPLPGSNIEVEGIPLTKSIVSLLLYTR